MICPTCHATIKDHSKFCSVCGSPIPQEATASKAVPAATAAAASQSATFGSPSGSYADALDQIKAMKPESVQAAASDSKFLLFLSGCLWIVPILGTFVSTIKASSGVQTMSFSLFGLTDFASMVDDEVVAVLISNLKSTLILYVVILLAIAAFAFWQSLTRTHAKFQVIYSVICLPVSTIMIFLLNIINNLFGAVSQSFASMGGHIGLNFFGWLVIIAMILIFVCDVCILWNLAKKANG